MVGKSDKNVHLEHLEDEIINLGYKGAQRSIAFVEALFQLFKGKTQSSVNVTVKWDGAPAVVVGTEPTTGMFFIATKHGAFAKNMKLAYSLKMIDEYYEGGLAETLKYVFKELQPLNIQDVLQGDVMFTPKNKVKRTIDGKGYLTFKPNTIMYSVPEGDPLYETIEKANLGIIFHTKYNGNGEVNTLSSSFGVDLSKVKSKTAWIQDASYRDLSGKLTLTEQESRTVSSLLASAKSCATSSKNFLDRVAALQGDLSIPYLFKIFVNKLIRDNKEIKEESLREFKKFVIERIQTKEGSVKTAAAKQKYKGVEIETEQFFTKHTTDLKNLVKLYTVLMKLKNIFVKKLNEAQSIPTFIETPEGFKQTDPEGYVAIDSTGSAVKLVNRLEFSAANFNAVKDWKKSTIPAENLGELKTMVFTYGRMNPPTIGHKKIIDKVIEIARAEKADYQIVVSHSQDKKKNPLSVREKIEFMKKMFPSIHSNLSSSSPTKPGVFEILEEYNKKYDKVIMVVGSDRVDSFMKLLHQFNGNRYMFKVIDVVSGGERDPDADSATSSISATKMREFAVQNDEKSFKQGLPSSASVQLAKQILEAVRKGLEVE